MSDNDQTQSDVNCNMTAAAATGCGVMGSVYRPYQEWLVLTDLIVNRHLVKYAYRAEDNTSVLVLNDDDETELMSEESFDNLQGMYK